MTTFQSYHRAPYTTISPTLPALSQATRTILIAGGSTGIGFNISRSFSLAKAARIILIGRRAAQLQEAKQTLLKEAKHDLEVLTETCDMGDEGSRKALWTSLKERGIDVHVLILNAAALPTPIESLTKDLADVRRMYEFNVFANLGMTAEFLGQGPEKGKVVIHVSSVIVHLNPTIIKNSTLALSKGAFTTLLSSIADETTPDKTQIVNVHPGTYFTDAAVGLGMSKDSYRYDDDDLCGHFAVWAASKEASFLHGRFVWSHWDVNEIRQKFKEANSPGFLRMGLQGVAPIGYDEVLEKMKRLEP